MSDELKPREWADGERAAWLADKIVSGSPDYCNDAADLLRNYSRIERETADLRAQVEASRKQEPEYVECIAPEGRDDLLPDEMYVLLDPDSFSIGDYIEDGYTVRNLYASPIILPTEAELQREIEKLRKENLTLRHEWVMYKNEAEALDKQLAEAKKGAVPEGYVIVPKELTFENGAKSALIGERFGGEFVSWTAVKEVHRAVVKLFSCSPHPETERKEG